METKNYNFLIIALIILIFIPSAGLAITCSSIDKYPYICRPEGKIYRATGTDSDGCALGWEYVKTCSSGSCVASGSRDINKMCYEDVACPVGEFKPSEDGKSIIRCAGGVDTLLAGTCPHGIRENITDWYAGDWRDGCKAESQSDIAETQSQEGNIKNKLFEIPLFAIVLVAIVVGILVGVGVTYLKVKPKVH